jgi:hypothetical protein
MMALLAQVRARRLSDTNWRNVYMFAARAADLTVNFADRRLAEQHTQIRCGCCYCCCCCCCCCCWGAAGCDALPRPTPPPRYERARRQTRVNARARARRAYALKVAAAGGTERYARLAPCVRVHACVHACVRVF